MLGDAAEIAREFLDDLPARPVHARADLEQLRSRLGRPLPVEGEDPRTVISELARDADPGVVASAGPRYFGFVVGGALPAAVAADWLTSIWDQNAAGYDVAPSVSVAEEVAAGWVRELLGLPQSCGIGFVTGCQMAHFTCLAAARHAVLREVGWDVEAQGLHRAPEVRVLASEAAHVTVTVACRMLGLGADRIGWIPTDEQGRMRPAALDDALGAGSGPTIVCAQAGDVNTGAFDPIAEVVELSRKHGAWCHLDGAFGLWAAVSPSRRRLLTGFERAHSWATDAHKWLNVPYDCGIAAVADASAQRAAMTSSSDYIPTHADDVPWGLDWVPEFSRRGRGVSVYAALRSLGRDGLTRLVDDCCDHAVRISQTLEREQGVEVLNEVDLNQVLLRFDGDDEVTDAVIDRVQHGGTCWMSGSTFGGRKVMRVSVVNWQTTAEDIDASARSIVRALHEVRTR